MIHFFGKPRKDVNASVVQERFDASPICANLSEPQKILAADLLKFMVKSDNEARKNPAGFDEKKFNNNMLEKLSALANNGCNATNIKNEIQNNISRCERENIGYDQPKSTPPRGS